LSVEHRVNRAWAHFSPSHSTRHRANDLVVDDDRKRAWLREVAHEGGAKFSPFRTILLVSEVGRRQRKADLAFSSAVSIAFIGAPSMAWDSMSYRPIQNRHGHDFLSARPKRYRRPPWHAAGTPI